MLEVLKFVLSDFVHFFGTVILIGVIGVSISIAVHGGGGDCECGEDKDD